jgi:hypothetical protein
MISMPLTNDNLRRDQQRAVRISNALAAALMPSEAKQLRAAPTVIRDCRCQRAEAATEVSIAHCVCSFGRRASPPGMTQPKLPQLFFEVREWFLLLSFSWQRVAPRLSLATLCRQLRAAVLLFLS